MDGTLTVALSSARQVRFARTKRLRKNLVMSVYVPSIQLRFSFHLKAISSLRNAKTAPDLRSLRNSKRILFQRAFWLGITKAETVKSSLSASPSHHRPQPKVRADGDRVTKTEAKRAGDCEQSSKSERPIAKTLSDSSVSFPSTSFFQVQPAQ